MIPRAEIEFCLAMAQKGLRSETPPEVMAELCRVYLAWVDAPEGSVNEVGGSLAAVIVGQLPSGSLKVGKRVKLVEVK